jgi:hypothetical protein
MAANIIEEATFLCSYEPDDEGPSNHHDSSRLEDEDGNDSFGPWVSAEPTAETNTSPDKSTPPPPSPAIKPQPLTNTPASSPSKPPTLPAFPPHNSEQPATQPPTFSHPTDALLSVHAITVVIYFCSSILCHDAPAPGSAAPWIGIYMALVAALLTYTIFSTRRPYLQHVRPFAFFGQ